MCIGISQILLKIAYCSSLALDMYNVPNKANTKLLETYNVIYFIMDHC